MKFLVHKNISSVILLFVASLAHGQSIQDRIKDQAMNIFNSVDSSNASEGAMIDALLKLQEASTLIGTEGGGSQRDVFCKPSGPTRAFVARSSDGFTFGEDVRIDDCRAMVARAANGSVCGPSSASRAFVYSISSGRALGSDVSFDQCLSFVQSSSRQLVCAPYSTSRASVARISDGKTLGSEVSNSQCIEVIRNATQYLVCAPSSSTRAYVTRIVSGEFIGEAVSFETCYMSIRSR